MIDLLYLMRPKQWVKNTFVFAPVLFSGKFVDFDSMLSVACAVVLFCLASSAAYIVNDLFDIERDRQHPVKKFKRPLASGKVQIWKALVLLSVLYLVVAVGWWWNSAVVSIIVVYLALNLAYTTWLKHVPVIDIFCVAMGFVLRVYAGALALQVPVSSWMFITTLCLALYLAAIKRRQELVYRGSDSRKVLEHYTVPLVERYAEMSATGALLFYSMYTVSTQPELVITIPLVLFGLFRYWYLVESLKGGESPTDALLQDVQLLLTTVIWVASCVWVLWPKALV